MKKWFQEYKFVIFLFILWRLALEVIVFVSPFLVPLHDGYNGPTPWTNMDGIHYIRIAKEGYFQYGEAFFPLYPLLIRWVAAFSHLSLPSAGALISNIGFFFGLIIFYTLLKKKSVSWARWGIAMMITFPSSFFFAAVYTEGLFFFLLAATIAFADKKNWIAAGIFGGLASATRTVGVLVLIPVLWEYWRSKPKQILWTDILGLLCIPLGLVWYMIFLFQRTGDPLMFFHAQSAFGANRSGSTLILLPQVIWRYCKIIFTAFGQPTPVSYAVSVAEFIFTLGAYSVLYYGLRLKEKWSYLIFGLIVLTIPTLTGTLSSIPRYVVTIFPIFIILGKIKKTWFKAVLLFIFSILQIVGAMLYFRGWFVA